ncbi:hypothetical protein ACFY6Y_22870, partial [Streptomyces sp. NPDC012829]
RRHGGTAARRHGGTAARRHGGTAARRHGGTAVRRHGGTAVRTGPDRTGERSGGTRRTGRRGPAVGAGRAPAPPRAGPDGRESGHRTARGKSTRGHEHWTTYRLVGIMGATSDRDHRTAGPPPARKHACTHARTEVRR